MSLGLPKTLNLTFSNGWADYYAAETNRFLFETASEMIGERMRRR